jgi:hypothetical protein
MIDLHPLWRNRREVEYQHLLQVHQLYLEHHVFLGGWHHQCQEIELEATVTKGPEIVWQAMEWMHLRSLAVYSRGACQS